MWREKGINRGKWKWMRRDADKWRVMERDETDGGRRR